MTKNKTYQVELDLHKQAKKRATDEGLTISEVVNLSLAAFLLPKQPAPKTPTRRAAK